MKKISILFVFVALLIIAMNAQEVTTEVVDESVVPSEVKSSFSSDFSGITPIKWEKHTFKAKNGKMYYKYVSVFDKDGLRHRARYKNDGTGLSVTAYYWFKKVENLPDAVKNYASVKYPDFKLNSGEKEKSLKSGKYVYRIRLKKGASKLVVYLNEKGEEVSKDNVDQEILDNESEGM